MTYRIVPITGRAARAWIAETHRHLPRLQGALFAVAVARDDAIVGVATAGNPPPEWQGRPTFIISRCAALPGLPGYGRHAAPVCSMLYSALCRAGRALGYREVWTYSLPDEDGRSIRAAGFEYMGETKGGEWDTPARRRGPAVNAEPKGRWRRML